DQSVGSKPGTKGTGKGTLKSGISKDTWILVSVGVFFLLLLLTFIGVKTWFWFHKPRTLDLAEIQLPQPGTKELTGGRAFLLVNKNSGRCATVEKGSSAPGLHIIQGPTPGQASAPERWILLKVKDDVFRLQNENSR